MGVLISPTAGKVRAVRIRVGQMVTETDEAFVIEGKSDLCAVHGNAGVVKEVLVNEGDVVSGNCLLAVIE